MGISNTRVILNIHPFNFQTVFMKKSTTSNENEKLPEGKFIWNKQTLLFGQRVSAVIFTQGLKILLLPLKISTTLTTWAG